LASTPGDYENLFPSDEPYPAIDTVRGSASPRNWLTGPRAYPVGTGAFGFPTTIDQVGDRGEWERLQALRDLSRSLPSIDRKVVEGHLRHRPSYGHLRHGRAWNKDSRTLPHARVQSSNGKTLTLQGVNVQILIEGARARTLVDHIFHNSHAHSASGLFEFPLPDGASPSFFALFPGNKTNSTAKVVMVPHTGSPRRMARPNLLAPREVMRTIDPCCWGEAKPARIVQIDPGLDEPTEPREGLSTTQETTGQAPLGTFRGRIGAILPGAHIRILMAYEETIPLQQGKLVYQYRLPTCQLADLSVTLQTDHRLAQDAQFTPADAKRESNAGIVTYRRSWRNVTNVGMITFQATPETPSVQSTSGHHDGGQYLLARLRPTVLEGSTSVFARHAVFLLDTSAGEHPGRVDRCIKLMQSILRQDTSIERFNVLTFNSGSAWLEPKGWLANTRSGRDTALTRLHGTILEGATDLSGAFSELTKLTLPISSRTPIHCFLLSDGKLSAGETELPMVVSRMQARSPYRLRWHCYQMGLGEENGELFDLLTRHGGGVYRCGSDRDIPAAAVAHRRPCLTIEQLRFQGGPEARDVFVSGRRTAVYPGGELLVAARFERPGLTNVVLEGTIGSHRVIQRFPIEIGHQGVLAARGWGELAVASLLAPGDPRLEPIAALLATEFGIPSRVTSFAFAEADMETESTLEKTLKIDLSQVVDLCWDSLGKSDTLPHRRDVLLARIENWGQAEDVRRDLRAIVYQMPEKELALPEVNLQSAPVTERSGGMPLARGPRQGRKSIETYLEETRRRVAAGQGDAAVRCLCGLLEEDPNDAEVTRLVSYRLVAMGRSVLAAHILTNLVERNPNDPATHRALAIALEESGHPARAALHYEVALGQLGTRRGWYAAVRDEYAHLLRKMMRDERQLLTLRTRLGIRLKELDTRDVADLRASMTWETTASQVELVVTDPTGKTIRGTEPAKANGATRTGPRHVLAKKAVEGTYDIDVELLRAMPETKAETFVTIQIIRNAGKSDERVETKRLLLWKQNEKVTVAKPEF
jgi:hypothetical protein